MIKANDTNVVVTAISVFPSLKEFGLEKMWIAFGQGKNLQWIPVHEVVNTIGPENTRGLPFFTRSLVAMLCLLSVAEERNVLGKHEMSAKSYQTPLPDSVSAFQLLMTQIFRTSKSS